MTLQSFLRLIACASTLVLLSACGSAGNTAATAPALNTATGPGNPSNGATLFRSSALACSSCHGDSGDGGIGPNISGSTTAGIGAWTETQFFNAVRSGESRADNTLCSLMVPFPASSVSDSGINDIYAFLTSQSNDTADRGTGNCNTP